jgi:hypothetical protein
MQKHATIDAIRTLNPTATPDFLETFTDDELSQYLDRLSRVAPRNTPEYADARPGPDRRAFAAAVGSPELC